MSLAWEYTDARRGSELLYPSGLGTTNISSWLAGMSFAF
jgi:hypothetical protein